MVVVAAIDGVDGSTNILAEASKLAEQFEVPLHIVFVYERSEHTHLANQYMDIAKPISDDRIDELTTQVVDDAAEGIVDEYEAVGRIGKPAKEIVAYADEVDADYVVVGGRSRSPVGKALFGSTAQGVLLDAGRPVLAVMAAK